MKGGIPRTGSFSCDTHELTLQEPSTGRERLRLITGAAHQASLPGVSEIASPALDLPAFPLIGVMGQG